MEKQILESYKTEEGLYWIKPFCVDFGLHAKHHYKKLKTCVQFSSVFNEGGCEIMGKCTANGSILLTLTGFTTWILLINPKIISPSKKEEFLKIVEQINFERKSNEEDLRLIGMYHNRITDLSNQLGFIGREIQMNQKLLKELLDKKVSN